jgi:hypothetical protein
LAREIIFMMISGNAYIDANKKPKSKSEIMKLSIDGDPEKVVKKRVPKLTEQDIRVYEQLQFNKNGTI